MPPPAPRTATLEAYIVIDVSMLDSSLGVALFLSMCTELRHNTHLAGGSGESPLLEEVEGLTSGEHCEEDGV